MPRQTCTTLPQPHRRYAHAAAQLRAAGISIEDHEYERIDLLTDIEDGMLLHLMGIAPFVVGVLK